MKYCQEIVTPGTQTVDEVRELVSEGEEIIEPEEQPVITISDNGDDEDSRGISLAFLHGKASGKGLDHNGLHNLAVKHCQVESLKDTTDEQREKLLQEINKLPEPGTKQEKIAAGEKAASEL